LVGLLIIWVENRSPRRFFLLCWTMGSLLAVIPGLCFREHYFVFLSPIVGILCSVTWRRCLAALQSFRRWRGLAIGTAVAFFAVPVTRLLWFYLPLEPDELNVKLYGGTFFVDSLRIAGELKESTAPSDCIVVLGSEPQLLYYCKRRSASEHIYMYPLMEDHDYAEAMQHELIADIERARPKVLVYCSDHRSWLANEQSSKSVIDWANEYVAAHYYQELRVESRGAAPSAFLSEFRDLNKQPRANRWIGVFRRRAGHN
jgi:hypothetical protein